MSDKSDLWASAFHKAQSAMPPIPKSKTVDTGSFSYKYADLPTILELVGPVLAEHGLAVSQSVVSQDERIGVETRIHHVSGSIESFGPVFLPAGNDAKSAGSAITYARRYSLCAALGIAADEDDDGQAAQPRREEPPTDVSEIIKTKVAIFKEWTDDEKRDIWKAHAVKVLEGKPQTRDEVDMVIKSMAEQYYEQFPPSGDEAPF